MPEVALLLRWRCWPEAEQTSWLRQLPTCPHGRQPAHSCGRRTLRARTTGGSWLAVVARRMRCPGSPGQHHSLQMSALHAQEIVVHSSFKSPLSHPMHTEARNVALHSLVAWPASPQADEDVLGVGDGSPFFLARHARRVLQLQPSAYRAAFLAVLRSGDALVATAAVRVLLALLMSRHIDSALLDAAGWWCSCSFCFVLHSSNAIQLPLAPKGMASAWMAILAAAHQVRLIVHAVVP